MTPRERRQHDANLRTAAILQMDDRIRDLEAKMARALDRIAALEPVDQPLPRRLPKIRVVK